MSEYRWEKSPVMSGCVIFPYIIDSYELLKCPDAPWSAKSEGGGPPKVTTLRTLKERDEG